MSRCASPGNTPRSVLPQKGPRLIDFSQTLKNIEVAFAIPHSCPPPVYRQPKGKISYFLKKPTHKKVKKRIFYLCSLTISCPHAAAMSLPKLLLTATLTLSWVNRSAAAVTCPQR
jgi:hypothetical protein